MRSRSSWKWFGVLIPAVVAAAILAGCGPKDGGSGGDDNHSGTSSSGDKDKTAKPLPIEARGSISGKVVVTKLDKDAKEEMDKKFKDGMKSDEFKACHEANVKPWEQMDQKWYIGEGDALQNAVVWLAPPDGYYYKLTSDDLDPEKAGWKKEKEIKQPHCAFEPHVMVLFAQYSEDGKKFKETDQKIVVKNNATTQHNTKINEIKYDSGPMMPDVTGPAVPMKLLKPSNKQPYVVNCNIHSWMNAYIWSFDHPFAAVTDENGKFEIKNAPADTELRLMVWHESESKPREVGKVKLKKGENTEEKTIEVEFKK